MLELLTRGVGLDAPEDVELTDDVSDVAEAVKEGQAVHRCHFPCALLHWLQVYIPAATVSIPSPPLQRSNPKCVWILKTVERANDKPGYEEPRTKAATSRQCKQQCVGSWQSALVRPRD